MTEPRPAPAGVLLAGPPGAPSIVFVHSTRLTGAMWAAQQAELAGEFRTIAHRPPAHGARAGEPFTLEGAADVLAAAIRDHATGGRAVVVGLSLGGYVAMALAAREPDPRPGARPVGSDGRAGRCPIAGVPGLRERLGPGRLEAARPHQRLVLPDALPTGARGADRRRRVLVQGRRPSRACHRRRAIPPAPGRLPRRDPDPQWRTDVIFRLAAPTFAAAAVDPRRVRLAGATHLANLDRPLAFSEAVRRFARSLPAD